MYGEWRLACDASWQLNAITSHMIAPCIITFTKASPGTDPSGPALPIDHTYRKSANRLKIWLKGIASSSTTSLLLLSTLCQGFWGAPVGSCHIGQTALSCLHQPRGSASHQLRGETSGSNRLPSEPVSSHHGWVTLTYMISNNRNLIRWKTVICSYNQYHQKE